ncbi:hypothetical protein LXL04_014918 [Taraxacum kok-saghyz]
MEEKERRWISVKKIRLCDGNSNRKLVDCRSGDWRCVQLIGAQCCERRYEQVCAQRAVQKGINPVQILPHLARPEKLRTFYLPGEESKEGLDSSKSEAESEWQPDHQPENPTSYRKIREIYFMGAGGGGDEDDEPEYIVEIKTDRARKGN